MMAVDRGGEFHGFWFFVKVVATLATLAWIGKKLWMGGKRHWTGREIFH